MTTELKAIFPGSWIQIYPLSSHLVILTLSSLHFTYSFPTLWAVPLSPLTLAQTGNPRAIPGPKAADLQIPFRLLVYCCPVSLSATVWLRTRVTFSESIQQFLPLYLSVSRSYFAFLRSVHYHELGLSQKQKCLCHLLVCHFPVPSHGKNPNSSGERWPFGVMRRAGFWSLVDTNLNHNFAIYIA